MDWDWSKFDALHGSNNSESSSGDAGVVEATADTVQGFVAASTTAEGVTSRTQVAIADGKGQLPQANYNEAPACDVRGSGALPARKNTAADTDEEPCADDVGGRNLRTKTSAAFWAGATRSWSARDASSGQSRTVPVAGIRAMATTTGRGSPLRESSDRLASGDTKKGEGGTKSANQRWKATDTKPASVDVTRAVRP
ncbi:unnamed protein product, partial [Ectocarpus fasciculatus]